MDIKQFEREDRYLVAKRKDVEQALPAAEIAELRQLMDKVAQWRDLNGKDRLCTVLVEAGWPEYEVVWKMLENRVVYGNAEQKRQEQEPVAYIHRNEYDEYRLEPMDSFKIKSIPRNVDIHLFTTPPDQAKLIESQAREIAEANEREAYESGLASTRLLKIAELQAHINGLREDLGKILVGYADKYLVERIATQALASTPSQSLARHDDEVIERCAKVCDEVNDWIAIELAEDLRKMKGVQNGDDTRKES